MEFNLKRFIDAQEEHYTIALNELRNGRKQSHWMWFVFPQIAGLGYSETAQYFAISGTGEAHAYLSHAVLGERIRECVSVTLAIQNRSLREIFGSPDDLKFRSSMTLFEYCSADDNFFTTALERYYGSQRDERTLEIIHNLPYQYRLRIKSRI
ncbi:MAG: DUF1810 domain-containing protein [Gammaproteobacteria bacterium]|nr:DUF1810 domain-containing protein [Gammaproteobacteria bacterium]